ncbi:MAG: amino acid transporter [Bradymonadia bacterium]|jgi:amino acid transporter
MYLVTVPTAMSMSSMTSNIRIGRGGVFSIISQSMGLEAGGAIGVPFYVAQSLSAALYIYAFTEAWAFLFPHHPAGLVACAVFVICALLTLLGAKRALGAQGVVMTGTIAALVSMAIGSSEPVAEHIIEFTSTPESTHSFAQVFAVFFPAATGILVGASMSGSLRDPRTSIPRGTLAAVAVSATLYLLVGLWCAGAADGSELRANTAIAFHRARFPEVVVIGVLASTFNAAISSMVAAPRVLQALASYGVVPFQEQLARTTASGEPRVAGLVSMAIIAAGLGAGSLDAIAPLLTVFFLITYASLNTVVFVEQWLGLPSFRPTFRVPLLAPAVGVVAAVTAILVTSPVFGLATLLMVMSLYAWLVRRRLPASFETARSGLLVSIAAWAARKIGELPASTERSWKPDILVPVTSADELAGGYRLLRAMVGAKGSVHIIGIDTENEHLDTRELARLSCDLVADGVSSKATSASAESYADAIGFTMSVLRGAFLPPNILFMTADAERQTELRAVVDAARTHEFGIVIRVAHRLAALGQERCITVWVRDQSPDWELSLKMASIDLSLLLALQIRGEWNGTIRLASVVATEDLVGPAKTFLTDLWIQARVPGPPNIWVVPGAFMHELAEAPRTDLNVMGLAADPAIQSLQRIVEVSGASCLFVQASGRESALA